MKLSAFLVSEASTMATNYDNAHMEHYNCANFQVADSRKAFSCQAARVVSASYNVVVIELQLVLTFSRISSRTATKLNQNLLYMEIANLFFLHTNSHAKMATRRWLRKVS